MHEETMAPATRRLFEKLAKFAWMSRFYLAGGTALALHLGHRISVDLDFFAERDLDESVLVQNLARLGNFHLLARSEQSVIGVLDGVKVSFLRYSYPDIGERSDYLGIRIASVEDIACMKCNAISSPGTKRDFIDLFFIVQRIPIAEILRRFEWKYASVAYNIIHVKKSLLFFADAEDDVMPKMIERVEWSEVKDFFIGQANLLH